MKIITEQMLRNENLLGCKEYTIAPDAMLTPLAREYLRKEGITVHTRAQMPQTPILPKGKNTYTDVQTGQGYEQKPEHMTHLRANLLVEKTHPRIRLRGCLDSFQAQVLWTQTRLAEPALIADLQEILDCARAIVAAEVKEEPLGEMTLFGMDEARLRFVSHHIKEEFGIPHPMLCYTDGETAALLNLLRTQIRTCELAAIEAFGQTRPDLICMLNRLSSAIYILMCRHLAQKEGM